MPDGNNAYQLSQIIEVRLNYNYYYIKYISASGNYYDEQKQCLGQCCSNVQLDSSAKKLSWRDNHSGTTYNKQVDFTTIKGQGLIKNPAVFEHPDFLELRQQKADTEWYQKILANIDNSLKEIDDFEAKQAEPFRQNQFVEQKFCEIILSAVKDSRKQIEDAKLKLEKEKQRYAN